MISGVTFHQNPVDNVYICYIEELSDELKEKIIEMLSSIWHGSVDANERPQFNYNTTVKRFLERYQTKTSDTKKGMIGELLSHLLIPLYINLSPISIMKNKEENSIRKGFDIVYTDENGTSKPITEKVIMPVIEGAIITAQGASNANIKSSIVSAVEAVTGLAIHKIQVFEMKN